MEIECTIGLQLLFNGLCCGLSCKNDGFLASLDLLGISFDCGSLIEQELILSFAIELLITRSAGFCGTLGIVEWKISCEEVLKGGNVGSSAGIGVSDEVFVNL